MKRIIIVTSIVLVLSVFFYFSGVGEQEQTTQMSVSPTVISESKPVPSEISNRMVFVPYWNIPSDENFSDYDSLIYFGITPEKTGELKDDIGLSGVETFVDETSPQKKRYITLRMLNTETNIEILANPSAQQSLLNETVEIAERYNFDGIVLDLEMSVIPFSDTQKDISEFVEQTVRKSHDNDLEVYMTLYGDTFYRGRPYDVAFLGEQVDGVLIMAYDFHKSRGEPGPNFPFERKGEYDFQQMVQDFSKSVGPDKVTVIFGMYGYDWTLGEQGLPLKSAKAIPLHEIQSDILPGCQDDCKVSTDPSTSESNVTYSDPDGYEHVLWYEDEASVEVKMDYLQEQGIGSIGYWVWGYF